MPEVLLIQTGEAPEEIRREHGGFADWFRAAMPDVSRWRVVRVDAGERLPAPSEVAAAVITGSAAMVTDRADWSERTAMWIRAAVAAHTPLFGVCYGHQLMAHALGGVVGWLPGGREIGTREVHGRAPEAADWCADLADSFPAQTTHRQAVLLPPPGAVVRGRSERDPYQWLQYGPLTLSTQFHPEFTAGVMRAYITSRARVLRAEGLDVEALLAAVRDTPEARSLLVRFAQAVARTQPPTSAEDAAGAPLAAGAEETGAGAGRGP